MIDTAIRSFIETQNISEVEWNGLAKMDSPQRKDRFLNELTKESELEDIDTEKEEHEASIQTMIGTFFAPLVEAPYVLDSSPLGDLNEVGALLQEISQQAFFLEADEERQNTIKTLQQLPLTKESTQENILKCELPLQERLNDSLQLLIEKLPQTQNESQSIETLQQLLSINESTRMNNLESEPSLQEVHSDSRQPLAEKFPQIHNENQSAETLGGQIDREWDRGKEETSFEAKTNINKNQVESIMEQFAYNELPAEQFTRTEFSVETGMKYEQTTLSNLADKLQQKIDYLQKFIVKTDKVFIQLEPENLGKIDVIMQKTGNKLMIEVDIHEQLAKKNVEVIFENLQMKLKEQNVEAQLSFTVREEKEQEKQQKQKRQQEARNNKASEKFAEILELTKQ